MKGFDKGNTSLFQYCTKTHAVRGQNNITEYNITKEKFMQYVDTTNYRIWLTTKPLSHKPSCVMLYFEGHLDEFFSKC